MKDMTEAEARKALKAALPWAKRFFISEPCSRLRYDQAIPTSEPWHVACDSHTKDAPPRRGSGFDVWGRGRTLREAVRRCIAAAREFGAA